MRRFPPVWSRALDSADKISEDYARDDALSAIAQHLPVNLPAALALFYDYALGRQTIEGRLASITSLTPHWREICKQMNTTEFELLTHSMRAIARFSRKSALQLMSDITTVLRRLGGDQCLLDIVDYIERTANWWP